MRHIGGNKGGPMKSLVIFAGLALVCAPAASSQVVQGAPTTPARPTNTSMRGDEVARQATTLDQLLVGRLSGVTVYSAPGGGIIVRMGGPTSFYSDQNPLFIVDGVPLEGRGNTLSWLDPHQIESIQALKDPTETAIYGVRGVNGVIIIKTKGAH